VQAAVIFPLRAVRERVGERGGRGVSAAGFPLFCVWTETVYEPRSGHDKATWDPGIHLSGIPNGLVPTILPLRPLWLGLLFNSFIYGTFWILIRSVVRGFNRALAAQRASARGD